MQYIKFLNLAQRPTVATPKPNPLASVGRLKKPSLENLPKRNTLAFQKRF